MMQKAEDCKCNFDASNKGKPIEATNLGFFLEKTVACFFLIVFCRDKFAFFD